LPVVVRSSEYACAAPETFELKFKRTGGGSAPRYEITIRHDGSATYRGLVDVPVYGPESIRIAPDMVQLLVDRLQSINFWELQDRYEPYSMHSSIETITLTVDARSKTVVNSRDDGPKAEHPPDIATRRAIGSVARAIEAAVDVYQWIAPGDSAWDRWLEASIRAQR
jgi:hypothetical protein